MAEVDETLNNLRWMRLYSFLFDHYIPINGQ